VTLEIAGRSKYTQLVTYHEFRYIHRYELVAIVNGEGVTYEIRCNGAPATPSLQNGFLSFTLVDGADLAFKLGFHVRSFSY
jgi:hypothetical protein